MSAKSLGVAALFLAVVAYKSSGLVVAPDTDVAVIREYINSPETDDPEFYQSVVDMEAGHAV